MQFNQPGAWVTSVEPNDFQADLGSIGSDGQDVQLIASFAELPGYTKDLATEGRALVMVCLTDKRSSQAAAELVAAGLRHVAVLRGGMKAWREGPG